jgi:hypothetical protein
VSGRLRGQALAAASAIAFAVSGCGGSQLSMDALRDQAGQVCDAAMARANRIRPPSTPAGTRVFLERGVAALRPELAQLRALRPPSDVADVYSLALGAFSRKLMLLDDTIRGLGRGTDPVIAIKTLQQGLAPAESAENGAWQALEIPACLNR